MIPSEGAARFHGSEEALAEALVTRVAEEAGYESSVGIADGLLAAVMAARANALIERGQSHDFLAPLPVDTLVHAAMERAQRAEVEDLVSVLVRLGLTSLGDFTALPSADVDGALWPRGRLGAAHGEGRGRGASRAARAEGDIGVEYVFEEPAERVEQLALVAVHVAEQLDAALLAAASRCSRVRIGARTVAGDELVRVWRTDVGTRSGAFTKHMADRVRWQLEGWLSGRERRRRCAGRPAAARAAHGADAHGRGRGAARLRAVVPVGRNLRRRRQGASGLERVQGLLGPEGVLAVARARRPHSPRQGARARLGSRGRARRGGSVIRGPAASPTPRPRRCFPCRSRFTCSTRGAAPCASTGGSP